MEEQNYLDHLVGVIGQPVAENPSAVIQHAAFDAMGLKNWRYLTIDVDKDKLEYAVHGLKAFKMRGFNCTIPHKIGIMQYLDEISESARLIGAVNTVVNTDGRLAGENTDGKGFMTSLRENGIDVRGKKAVVLGAGGASRAICVEMGLAGVAEITIVNRSRPLAEELLGLIQAGTQAKAEFVEWKDTYSIPEGTDILVNATSVGLYPNVDELPNIDLDSIKPEMFVQDVIPNPTETALNIEIWTGQTPDKAVMYRALEEALS